MKIVIVGTAYPLRGGIAHFNALLANHLGQRHAAETVTFKRQYPKYLFPGKTQEESGRRGDQTELRVAPQIIDSINPFNWIFSARYISALKPDLLIFKYWMPFFGPCFGTIAKLVKKSTGCKVLFICDNIIPHERRPGDIAFTHYAFRQSDFFIVQSDSVERDLQEHFPGSIYRKVAHPVYEIFGRTIPMQQAKHELKVPSKNVALFFGYVRKYKGLMLLLEAVKILHESLQDFTLLVVGEFYDEEEKYREKIKELNIGDIVRVVSDYVPNEDVSRYFSAANVVVLPYLSATQSGIVQIAYNFDKPVIATNVGGLAEVVIDKQTGFIVPPNDPAALADALRRFFLEGHEPEFTTNVLSEKKKYSWDNIVDAIEDLMK